ncbi:hypothetical protein [Mycobacterium sp.]|uniref:hypothetical protein n=1 Tax=Mycobacterium sp. TaxID=1785 RepID=UPI003F965C65
MEVEAVHPTAVAFSADAPDLKFEQGVGPRRSGALIVDPGERSRERFGDAERLFEVLFEDMFAAVGLPAAPHAPSRATGGHFLLFRGVHEEFTISKFDRKNRR